MKPLSNFDVQNPPSSLDQVDLVLARLRRKGHVYMVLGFLLYTVGSTACLLLFFRTLALGMAIQMVLFQTMVIYIFTKEMYPAIRGAFEVGLIANRQAIPAMERLAHILEKLDGKESDLRRMGLDIRDEAVKLREEVGRLVDGLHRPIKPAMPKPE